MLNEIWVGDCGWSTGNLFQPVKIFMSVEPSDPERNSIKILYAEANFYLLFGYSSEDLPLQLRELVSDTHSPEDFSPLEQNLISGAATSAHMFLRGKTEREPIPCHLTFGVGGVAGVGDQFNPHVVNFFFVATIRSATFTGNTRAMVLSRSVEAASGNEHDFGAAPESDHIDPITILGTDVQNQDVHFI